MLTTRDKVWNRNFRKLKAYIDEFHHLPDKKKVENRGILNWVKYNRKKIKAGTLDPEKQRLFCELLDSRQTVIAGSTRNPVMPDNVIPDLIRDLIRHLHPSPKPSLHSTLP